ncbi:hypothetical protein DFH06DRAFT_1125516 [Mycena polygramma]|nr:hypothetical protein DFH06DRAFT_1125516 [Mycena polygramma]
MENPFYKFYHKGTRQNAAHFHTYCKACVKQHLESIGASLSDLTQGNQAFKDACQVVGSTRSDKLAWVAHLIGGRGVDECLHSSVEAKAYAASVREETKSTKRARTESAPGPSDVPPAAKKQQLPSKKQKIQSTLTDMVFRRNDMPYSDSEAKSVQRQALRAIVSSGAPLQIFEDPEMEILFGMLRTTAPAVIPSAKVAGGRLLNSAAAEVEVTIAEVMRRKQLGLATDGWKSKKDSVNALCANVEFHSYLLELVEVTALGKDGQSLCDQFGATIDRIEEKYDCIVIYFTTDADGGSKKGRILLGKKRPWLILPSCWAHQLQFQESVKSNLEPLLHCPLLYRQLQVNSGRKWTQVPKSFDLELRLLYLGISLQCKFAEVSLSEWQENHNASSGCPVCGTSPSLHNIHEHKESAWRWILHTTIQLTLHALGIE